MQSSHSAINQVFPGFPTSQCLPRGDLAHEHKHIQRILKTAVELCFHHIFELQCYICSISQGAGALCPDYLLQVAKQHQEERRRFCYYQLVSLLIACRGEQTSHLRNHPQLHSLWCGVTQKFNSNVPTSLQKPLWHQKVHIYPPCYVLWQNHTPI